MIQDNNSENTNAKSLQMAVKSRFFGQYWGQDYTYKNEYGKFKGNLSDENSIYHFKNHLKNNNPKLLLKPLSKITDEDVCELLPLVSFQFSSRYTDEQIKEEIKSSVLDTEMMPSELFDFLRSKGYALPFMNYSVDDLISFGWVQLL